MPTIGSFRISRSYYSYSICLVFWTRRLSIQYVYERVFFCFSLVSQSGCKTKTSFCFSQEKFKVFFGFFSIPISSLFLTSLSMNFRVLRGANVTSVFKSHKLFGIFFFFISKDLNSFSCQYFSERLCLLRVQKYHLYLHLQAFLLHFFHVFLFFFLTH